MRRHSWQPTGRTTDASELAVGPSAVIDECRYCQTERVPDREYRSTFLYRGGRASVAGRPLRETWMGYTVLPQCVER
jgi:hypothetical protein